MLRAWLSPSVVRSFLSCATRLASTAGQTKFYGASITRLSRAAVDLQDSTEAPQVRDALLR